MLWKNAPAACCVSSPSSRTASTAYAAAPNGERCRTRTENRRHDMPSSASLRSSP